MSPLDYTSVPPSHGKFQFNCNHRDTEAQR